MSEQSIIRPEILAAKMAAVGNFKAPKVREQLKAQPRLFELFWLLQAMSMRPGGLDKLCEEFLAEFAARIGTAAMRAAKGKAEYSPKQVIAILKEIPRRHRPSVSFGLESRNYFLDEPYDDPSALYEKRGNSDYEQERLEFISKLTRAYFHALCRDFAAEDLPGQLARVCNEPQTIIEDPWYFDGLLSALVEFMDAHAKRTLAGLAKTEVSLKIFDAMEYAWQEKALVHVEGDSRFGKTQSVKTWCAAWPGKARLVTVPCSNSDADLIRAFAEALGMDFRSKRRIGKSKPKSNTSSISAA